MEQRVESWQLVLFAHSKLFQATGKIQGSGWGIVDEGQGTAIPALRPARSIGSTREYRQCREPLKWKGTFERRAGSPSEDAMVFFAFAPDPANAPSSEVCRERAGQMLGRNSPRGFSALLERSADMEGGGSNYNIHGRRKTCELHETVVTPTKRAVYSPSVLAPFLSLPSPVGCCRRLAIFQCVNGAPLSINFLIKPRVFLLDQTTQQHRGMVFVKMDNRRRP